MCVSQIRLTSQTGPTSIFRTLWSSSSVAASSSSSVPSSFHYKAPPFLPVFFTSSTATVVTYQYQCSYHVTLPAQPGQIVHFTSAHGRDSVLLSASHRLIKETTLSKR